VNRLKLRSRRQHTKDPTTGQKANQIAVHGTIGRRKYRSGV